MLFNRKKTSDPDSRTIVLVGHCLPDKFMLKNAIGRFVPGAVIEVANSEKALAPYLHEGCVLLVNRALDGSFETESGIELIGRVTKTDAAPTAILVSNFEDAQAEAVTAGALPGFGKNDLYAEDTGTILRDAVIR